MQLISVYKLYHNRRGGKIRKKNFIKKRKNGFRFLAFFEGLIRIQLRGKKIKKLWLAGILPTHYQIYNAAAVCSAGLNGSG